jgi:hypothetical protein
MIERARERWREAIFCITHDVKDTRDFERVVELLAMRAVCIRAALLPSVPEEPDMLVT